MSINGRDVHGLEMRSFQHVTPRLRLFSGPTSLEAIGRELERLECRRALIVCGATLAQPGSALDLVRAALGKRCVGVFPGSVAHNPLPAVEAAARELQRTQADAVVAVGGGSAIVTARAASILAAESEGPHGLCTTLGPRGELRSPKLLAPKLPQLVVPTTPTTASVKAGSAVFDPATGERLALFDPKTRAQAVFVHPQLLMSAPLRLVLSAGLNTLSMAIEGLTSRSGDPLSDGMLMHALRLLAQRLPDPALAHDPAARADLVLAAVLCGQGTDHTGAGITTVLGHAIGARHGVENGASNAAVLAHALRFNGTAATDGLRKVAAALSLAPAEGPALVDAVIDAVNGLVKATGSAQRLRDLGVPREALPGIAAGSLGDWFLRGNPRRVQQAAELQRVLDQAW